MQAKEDGMKPEFRVSARISKPVGEVFDAVVDPNKLGAYFVTTGGGASAPLVEGSTVIWWGDVPVEVEKVVRDEKIVLRWDGGAVEDQDYKTRVEMKFDRLDDGGTMVTIAEGGWQESQAGLQKSYLNCEGWTQMICCMKAWLEYGINLREGYYPSETRGEPARENNNRGA
jgi:uncharacterized protein YndB with AHSA1/START domain